MKWESLELKDVLAPNLSVVFVGINPGKRSAEVGRHFAGHNNFFWRLLYEAGFTPRQLSPEDDQTMTTYGYGLTNIVTRASRSSSDLNISEFNSGGDILLKKLRAYQPKVVCLLGKQVYRSYAGLSASTPVAWGAQMTSQLDGTIDFVAPNPSARSTVPYQDRLRIFQDLKKIVDS